VAGAGHCAYVRVRVIPPPIPPNPPFLIHVIDVTDPANPVDVGSVPASGSESMRAVVTDNRAVLVSGGTVYDISDCTHPVLKGQIKWPKVQVSGVSTGLLPHDLRVNHEGTKVFASFGLWQADISNLDDPSTWTVTNYTCAVGAQFWPAQMQAAKGGLNPCTDAVQPDGTVIEGQTGLQAALVFPSLAHGPDTNGTDTRWYGADVGGRPPLGVTSLLQQPSLSIVDLTQNPPRLLDQIPGAGYSIDWFQTANGKEFLLHNPEGGTSGAGGVQLQPPSDTCVPEQDRPQDLGWDFAAFLTDVTHDKAKNVSELEIAINKPEFCQARQASGHDPTIGYHTVDNPNNARIAILSYGTAGLRVFDIRETNKPVEVAYFNHGPTTGQNGVPYYDASRGLIYLSDSGGFKVLRIQPQVRDHVGLGQ
jgi:hypothetical protein